MLLHCAFHWTVLAENLIWEELTSLYQSCYRLFQESTPPPTLLPGACRLCLGSPKVDLRLGIEYKQFIGKVISGNTEEQGGEAGKGTHLRVPQLCKKASASPQC